MRVNEYALNRGGDMSASATRIDVTSFIDAQKIGSYQIRLLLICAAVMFCDGFDAQAIGYVAPSIAKEWAVPRGGLGPVLSASLMGLMIGALSLGPIADRIGRRWIILASTLAFGVFTLGTMFTSNVNELMVLRFLTGLGLGGAMPNAVSLTAEFSPLRRRSTMVMCMFTGFSIGAAVGGGIAAWLIPSYGWRAVFLVGGAAPLLLLPFLFLKLPESVRFLALRGTANAAVSTVLARMYPQLSFAADTHYTTSEPHLPGIPVLQLLRDGRAVATLLIWVLFFCSLLDLFFLSNWLPTVLNDLGASVSVSALLGALLQVGGVVGTFALGSAMDRVATKALGFIYLVAVIAIASIGSVGHTIPALAIAIFFAGFCIVGGQNCSNATAATFYPTALRATGVGWAFGVGRIGSIIGPIIGGVLLAMHWAPQELFLVAAIPAGVAALAGFALRFAGVRGPAAHR